MTTKLSESQITAALDAGIISAAQAQSMRAALHSEASQAQRAETAPPNNPQSSSIGHEDDMRFLRSFSDIFITIGLIILTLGLSGITQLWGGGAAYLLAAIPIWFGADYFGRKKRAHLPSLCLALTFLLYIHRGTGALLPNTAPLAALITVISMTVFYWRIRLPFCIALIAAACLVLLFSLLTQFLPGLTGRYLGVILAFSGLSVFAIAMIYDIRDTQRMTRFADNAFWLHFLAAPLIIHGLAIMGANLKREEIFGSIPVISLGQFDALIILVIFTGLSLIGLAINRRALIVSALGYAAFAIFSLINGFNLSFLPSLFFMLLTLGSMITLLGIAWHQARAIILKFLPDWPIFPPPFIANYQPN